MIGACVSGGYRALLHVRKDLGTVKAGAIAMSLKVCRIIFLLLTYDVPYKSNYSSMVDATAAHSTQSTFSLIVPAHNNNVVTILPFIPYVCMWVFMKGMWIFVLHLTSPFHSPSPHPPHTHITTLIAIEPP